MLLGNQIHDILCEIIVLTVNYRYSSLQNRRRERQTSGLPRYFSMVPPPKVLRRRIRYIGVAVAILAF